MNAISKSGRTILFVSHNLSAVKNLCTRGIFLKNGKIAFDGPVSNAIENYLSAINQRSSIPIKERLDREGDGSITIKDISISDQNNTVLKQVFSGQKVFINVSINNENAEKFYISINIIDEMGACISHLSTRHSKIRAYGEKRNMVSCKLNSIPLPAGNYSLTVTIANDLGRTDRLEGAFNFDVIDGDFFGTGKLPKTRIGLVYFKNSWEIN